MAHIITTSKELNQLPIQLLPNKSTIIEQNDDGKPLKRYKITNDKLKLDIDFIDHDRDFSEEEANKFGKNLTKTKVLDFFLNFGHDYEVPQRECDVYDDKMYEYFEFINTAGTYSEVNNEIVNNFSISIARNESNIDLSEAEKEVKFFLQRVKKNFPNRKEENINIREYTCSEYGIYELLIPLTKNGMVSISRTTWGKTSIEKTFDNLLDALKYIRKNHYK